MKTKKIFVVGGILSLLLFAAAPVQGASETSFYYSYWRPDLSQANERLDIDFNQPLGTDLKLTGGAAYGGSIELPIRRTIKVKKREGERAAVISTRSKLRIDFGYFGTKTEGTGTTTTPSYTKEDKVKIGLQANPIFVSRLYERESTTSRFSYFMGAGIGLFIANVKATDNWILYYNDGQSESGGGSITEVMNSVGYQLMGGIKFQLGKEKRSIEKRRSWFFFVEGKYIWAKSTSKTLEALQIDWSGFTGAIGFVFRA